MLRALRVISMVSLLVAAAQVPAVHFAAARPSRATEQRPPAAVQAPRNTPKDSLAIIVSKSNPIANLSLAELRQYFLGELTQWPNGRRVIIVMRDPSQPERVAALRIIYDMREQDFHSHFLHAKFTGEMLDEPRVLDTASRVLNFVILQPGAIGYVRAAEAGSTVKVVRVDGLLPGDANYKLTF